jgi:hypothetical protein
MANRTPWILMMSLLLVAPTALADDNDVPDPNGEPAPTDEPEPEPEPGPEEPAPDEGPEDAPTSPDEADAPDDPNEPEVEETVPQWRLERRVRLQEKAQRDGPKYMSIFLGVSGTSVFDEGLLQWQEQADIPQFSWAVDVFPHERIGIGVAGTLGGWRKVVIANAPDTTGINLETRTASLEAAAKVVFTPPYLPVRPYLRGGGGARIAVIAVEGATRNDRLAKRWHEGVAGYGLVGFGIEVTTPRIWDEVEVPWAIGLRLEGGLEIGGGGDVVMAPSVDLGTAGRLDLGPAYVDVGLLLLF